jgi:probable rRNA maturation factor
VNRVEIDIAYPQQPDCLKELEHKCLEILRALEIRDWVISLLLTDDKTIRELNKKYRHLDKPTDVLSFSQSEGAPLPPRAGKAPLAVGDIVISLDSVQRNALDMQAPLEQELWRVLVHGILHLRGLDHNEENPDDPMLCLQEKILRRLGKEKVY